MTEDNELIEIMARAIWEADDLNSHEWINCPCRDIVIGQARAALTAYRNHEVEL